MYGCSYKEVFFCQIQRKWVQDKKKYGVSRNAETGRQTVRERQTDRQTDSYIERKRENQGINKETQTLLFVFQRNMI